MHFLGGVGTVLVEVCMPVYMCNFLGSFMAHQPPALSNLPAFIFMASLESCVSATLIKAESGF